MLFFLEIRLEKNQVCFPIFFIFFWFLLFVFLLVIGKSCWCKYYLVFSINFDFYNASFSTETFNPFNFGSP